MLHQQDSSAAGGACRSLDISGSRWRDALFVCVRDALWLLHWYCVSCQTAGEVTTQAPGRVRAASSRTVRRGRGDSWSRAANSCPAHWVVTATETLNCTSDTHIHTHTTPLSPATAHSAANSLARTPARVPHMAANLVLSRRCIHTHSLSHPPAPVHRGCCQAMGATHPAWLRAASTSPDRSSLAAERAAALGGGPANRRAAVEEDAESRRECATKKLGADVAEGDADVAGKHDGRADRARGVERGAGVGPPCCCKAMAQVRVCVSDSCNSCDARQRVL